MWINGPFACGKYNDCSIFLKGMAARLGRNERVEVNDGYNGASPKYTKVPGSCTARKERKEIQSTVRARHETFNKRLKQWGSMRNVWHHGPTKHATAVRAVAVINQIILQFQQPLFHVQYND